MTTPVGLKPIQTRYSGHFFRSRCEARWAVFFDHLNLRWEYEVEGFELPDGTRYLPDFKIWTPQGSWRWVEIKPSNITADPKFAAFSDALTEQCQSARLVSGTPLQWLTAGHSICPRCGLPEPASWSQDSYCWSCDMETPCGGDHAPEHNGVLCTTWTPHKGSVVVHRPELRRFADRVNAAAVKAQSARFEFGEQG